MMPKIIFLQGKNNKIRYLIPHKKINFRNLYELNNVKNVKLLGKILGIN